VPGKPLWSDQIIGLAKPDSGRITIDDVDIIAKPAMARSGLFLPGADAGAGLTGLPAIQAIEL